MRRLLITLALFALAAPAAAQSRRSRPDAASAREAAAASDEGRAAVNEGRLPDAFHAFRNAATLAPDRPEHWRALGEVAERLRVDEVAIDAYGRYLELAPDAEDHAEIQGRLQALEQLAGGARFVLGEESGALILLAAPEGGRAPSRRPGNVLVDWQGRPVRARATNDLLTLAEWDGSLRNASDDEGAGEPSALPSRLRRGLGRQLATP